MAINPNPRVLYVWFDGDKNNWRASWTEQIGRVLQIEVEQGAEPPLLWDVAGLPIVVEK